MAFDERAGEYLRPPHGSLRADETPHGKLDFPPEDILFDPANILTIGTVCDPEHADYAKDYIRNLPLHQRICRTRMSWAA